MRFRIRESFWPWIRDGKNSDPESGIWIRTLLLGQDRGSGYDEMFPPEIRPTYR